MPVYSWAYITHINSLHDLLKITIKHINIIQEQWDNAIINLTMHLVFFLEYQDHD